MEQTKFNYKRAIELQKERRRQVWKWKELRYSFGWEFKDELKRLDTDDALAQAIEEMSDDEIIALVRRMARFIQRDK